MASFSQNLIGRSGNFPYDQIGKNIDFSSTCIKTSRFFAQLILNNVMHHLIASFFRFWVTWPENRVRKNLPIDFEVIVVNYDPLYGVLYIKRKLMSSGTQKHSFHEFFSTSDEVTVISYFEWSKWPFPTKFTQIGYVTHQTWSDEPRIPKKLFWWKIERIVTSRDENQYFEINFQKFLMTS